MPPEFDPHHPTVRRYASQVVARAAAVVGLAGVAVIHLLDSIGKFHETPYMGWLYIGLMLGCILTGAALLAGNFREAWIAAVILPLGAIIGFVLTRTTGLPQAKGDIGNWTEPLGLAALFTEGVLITVGLYAIAALRPVSVLSRRVWNERRTLAA